MRLDLASQQKAVVEAEHRVSDLVRDVDGHVATIVRLEQQVELQVSTYMISGGSEGGGGIKRYAS